MEVGDLESDHIWEMSSFSLHKNISYVEILVIYVLIFNCLVHLTILQSFPVTPHLRMNSNKNLFVWPSHRFGALPSSVNKLTLRNKIVFFPSPVKIVGFFFRLGSARARFTYCTALFAKKCHLIYLNAFVERYDIPGYEKTLWKSWRQCIQIGWIWLNRKLPNGKEKKQQHHHEVANTNHSVH